KKPLFVARWHNSVVFGSSILAMVAIQNAAVRPANDVLTDYWRYSYIPPDRSVLSDCAPVLPGEVQEFAWDGTKIRTSHCFPDAQPEKHRKHEEICERLSFLVGQSIERRLHNNPN